jgi:uncharacterized protein (TIGR02246 family)
MMSLYPRRACMAPLDRAGVLGLLMCVAAASAPAVLIAQVAPAPAAAADVDLSNPDVAAIAQVAKDFSQAYAAGDVDRTVSFYSPEVIYMANGMPNHAGRDIVRQIYEGAFAANRGHVDVHLDEVKVFGDVAYDRATFTVTLTPKAGGKPSVSKGRLLEILHKEGGKWRTFRVMTNATE